jgi:Fic-DOC domain mobile mystery protein B
MTERTDPHGTTPLNRDESEGLLLPHVTTRDELNRWEQENIVEAMDWLDRTKPRDILSEPFARELHRRMFRHVWKWAGSFRQSDKNLGVPWWRIPEDLKKLCDDAAYWIDHKTYRPDELAARCHHQLVSIHPFPNGNGRHARLMADLLLENRLDSPRFSWGQSNLVESGEARRAYLDALRKADRRDLSDLLRFARS